MTCETITFVPVFGEKPSIPTKLLAGLAVASGCCALTYGIAKLCGYGAIAPYPHIAGNRVTRALQRAVTDKTKKKVETHFYPLDSLRTVTPRRACENGHAVSGAVRDAARRLIDEAIAVVGGTKFELNPNPNSSTGSRSHFHFAVGDLAQDFANDLPMPDSYIVGVDVDYYIRSPDVLLQYARPVVLHTFNPRKVSGFDADAPFTIRDNKVEYKVSGGSKWEHHVWDWCEAGEFVASQIYTGWKQWLLELPLRLLGFEHVCMHKIHHCRPWLDCPDRALVYTIPQYTFWRFAWLPSEIGVRDLRRIRYTDDTRPGWNRLEYVTDDNKLMVSIGREGEHAHVEIEKSELDMLSGLSATQSVNARLIGMGYKDPLYTSLVVQYYTGKKVVLPVSPTVYKPTMPRVHWPVTSDVDVPEVSARQYTPPLVSDCMLMPMIKRWETMSESLERRVTFVANDKKPSDRIARIVDAFVKQLNGGVVGLVPLSIEETIERLNKPSQQLQLRAVFELIGIEPRELIESFNKNEPGMKNARIISGFSDILFLLKVSRYTLAYTDSVLKTEHNEHWYHPGLNPTQIADKVCEFVSDCDGEVVETDYSNLDGRVSSWMQRNIAQKAMLQAFHPDYRTEIISWMDTIIHCPAKAKRFGFRYDPGVGVKSGSPTTTPHNTIYNAATEFIGIALEQPEICYHDAFMQIGPKCGDDGLSRACYAKAINKAARALGLEVKVERYNPELGLCYLSRVFVDPLVTNTTMQDPLRTLRKLHVTTRDPTIPLADAACDRVEGYLCTDALTPLISDYCKMVLRVYAPEVSPKSQRDTRRSRNKEKPYWLTCDGSWPQEEEDKPKMLQVLSARTGIDTDVVERLICRLTAMETPWEKITHDSEVSEAKNTIDEDGVMPDSVDASFTKLNDAKQARANPATTTSGRCKRGTGAGDAVPRRAEQRASGPRKPPVLPTQDHSHRRADGGVTTGQAKRSGIPGGSRARGSETKPRREASKAGGGLAKPVRLQSASTGGSNRKLGRKQ